MCHTGSRKAVVATIRMEMELHMIYIIYVALPMREQTEKTTFSCKDDCILTKHTPEVQKVVNPVILDDRKYIQNQGLAENISKT